MRLSSVATIRFPALTVLAAGEIWGLLHFRGDTEFTPFLIGSVALWLVALFVFADTWFENRQITFGEYGWLPFALLSALETHRNHDRGLEVFWLGILALLAAEIFLTMAKDGRRILGKSPAPSSLRNVAGSRMPSIVSALIYMSALAWLGQFLPYQLPSWARIALLIPAMLLMVRAFYPDRWFQRSTDAVHTLNSSANGGGS